MKVSMQKQLARLATRPPKLRDVIEELLAVRATIYKSPADFFAAWGTARKKLYKTREWGKFKLEVFARSRGICESCRKRKAEQIHHRERVYDNPRRILDKYNVLHVCLPCHNAAHGSTGQTE